MCCWRLGAAGSRSLRCVARHGISPASYYRYKSRYLAEDVAGLEERSRRPHGSPGQIDAERERMICELRTRHPRWGARRIRAELARGGIEPPAVSTVHQVLRRNYLVTPPPQAAAGRQAVRAGGLERSLADRRDPRAARGRDAGVGDRRARRPRALSGGGDAFPDATTEAAWTRSARPRRCVGCRRALPHTRFSSDGAAPAGTGRLRRVRHEAHPPSDQRLLFRTEPAAHPRTRFEPWLLATSEAQGLAAREHRKYGEKR